jgi:hypothetical protein
MTNTMVHKETFLECPMICHISIDYFDPCIMMSFTFTFTCSNTQYPKQFYVGDRAGPKAANTTQFYHNYINGMNLQIGGAELCDLFGNIKLIEADVASLRQETNIDTTQYGVRGQKIHATLKKLFDNASIAMSSSAITMEKEYKLCGTMVVAHNGIMGQILEKSDDPL